MPPKTLADFFGGAAPKPAPAKKPQSANAENVLTVDSYPLSDAMTALLATHPTAVPRIAWPIPGVLGMGMNPTDKSDPAGWLSEQHVRVVVDVAADEGGQRVRSQLITTAREAGAVVVTLPISSRLEMGTADREALVSACRVLHACLAAMIEAKHTGEQRAGSMYLCDSRGGGVAALIAILLIGVECNLDFDTARVYVTRCWRDKSVQNGLRAVRMFPEGDTLRKAGSLVAGRLRQQPIAMAPNESEESATPIFGAHRVVHMGRAMLTLCDMTAAALPGYRLPFDRLNPFSIVVWLQRTGEQPADVPTLTRRRVWDEDDGRPRRRRMYDDED